MKVRIKRKLLKKQNRQPMWIIDVASIPKGVTMEEYFMLYKQYRILIYDSTIGNIPRVLNNDCKYTVLDMQKHKELINNLKHK